MAVSTVEVAGGRRARADLFINNPFSKLPEAVAQLILVNNNPSHTVLGIEIEQSHPQRFALGHGILTFVERTADKIRSFPNFMLDHTRDIVMFGVVTADLYYYITHYLPP